MDRFDNQKNSNCFTCLNKLLRVILSSIGLQIKVDGEVVRDPSTILRFFL